MKKFMMTALATAMMSSVAMAADELSVPNTFVQGEDAVASEVNANFSALVQAINESNERIDALEEQLEKANSVDVAGRAYNVQTSAVALQKYDADPNNQSEDSGFWNIDFTADKFVFTFEDDASKTATIEYESEIKGDLWEDGTMRLEEDLDAGNETFTWGQEGNKVLISEGGNVVAEFLVSPGAGVIYAVDSEISENDPGSPSCGDGTQTCYKDEIRNDMMMGILQTTEQ
jgi:hypothetical protein